MDTTTRLHFLASKPDTISLFVETFYKAYSPSPDAPEEMPSLLSLHHLISVNSFTESEFITSFGQLPKALQSEILAITNSYNTYDLHNTLSSSDSIKRRVLGFLSCQIIQSPSSKLDVFEKLTLSYFPTYSQETIQRILNHIALLFTRGSSLTRGRIIEIRERALSPEWSHYLTSEIKGISNVDKPPSRRLTGVTHSL